MKNDKSVLFFICIVLVFTAQTYRPDDKGQKEAAHGRPAPSARPVNVSHARAQVSREAPRQTVERPQVIEPRIAQTDYRSRPGPQVYALPPQGAPAENNRLFHQQHHNHWQPLYNFYNGQYNFYPYVNVTQQVEFTPDYVSILYDGQNYFYDRGSFYVQNDQGYLAVPPPIGIIVSAIPANARQLEVDGQVYFRKKGVFYIQVAQGYQVVAPVPWPSEGS